MAASSTTVDFLYRAMVERDPKKRRVKPVERHLLQLDFGDLDDSSDDSDFKVTDQGEQPDDDDSDSNDSVSSDTNDDADEDGGSGDEDEEDEIESTEGSRSDASCTIKKNTITLAELIEKARIKQAQARQRIASADVKADLKVLICAVCLGDISEENDEIVECDGCSVSVHEGCYGISDSDSVNSTISSSSTEPWFCEACRAGNTNPTCELCPNLGGIFKETEVGKWVHLVCALYIPGVAFGDVDKLSMVTLFEMPYSKWGAKACVLCEDERYSRTGVCICCDAGLCRNYFHASCAQREGLLSEASPEEDIADPFFAHCKLHADKMIARNKRRNWLALQSQVKQRIGMTSRTADEQCRIALKLQRHRQKYLETKASKPLPWVPTQKMPRLLMTSSTACRKLIRKAKQMDIDTRTLQIRGNVFENLIDIRKKWNIPPAFSLEFISYYLDRNERMQNMRARLDELLTQNSQLQDEEQCVRKKYDLLLEENEKFKSLNALYREQGLALWKLLDSISGKKHNIPDVLLVKKVVKLSLKHGKKVDLEQHSIALNKCSLCKQSNDQHLLAKCDTCRLFYHLGCLDPPLTRMPKKTKLQGWQCSECDKTDEEEKDDDVDPNAPRKLREHIKEPVKFTLPLGGGTNGGSSSANEGNGNVKKSRSFRNRSLESKRLTKPLQSVPEVSAVSINKTNVVKQPDVKPEKRKIAKEESVDKEKPKDKLQVPVKKAKRLNALSNGTQKAPALSDVQLLCVRCDEVSESRFLVSCDECGKCYHFQCLDPPLKKSPKQRGYMWHCEDCDLSNLASSSSSSSSSIHKAKQEEDGSKPMNIKPLKIILEKKGIKEKKSKDGVKTKLATLKLKRRTRKRSKK